MRFAATCVILSTALIAGCGRKAERLTGATNVDNLAHDGTHLYWTEQLHIRKAPRAGGLPVEVLTAKGAVLALAMDAQKLYFADNAEATIAAAPKTGGAATTLATKQYGVFALIADDKQLYWVAGCDLRSMAKAGGEVKTMLSQPGCDSSFMAIVVDPQAVYLANAKAGTITRMPLSSGKAQVLAKGQEFPVDVELDAEHAYWVSRGTDAYNSSVGTVSRMPKDGGEVKVLALHQKKPSALVVDATHVYWTNQGTDGASHTDGAVMRVSKKGGGEPEALMKRQISADDILLDAGALLWVAYDDKTGEKTIRTTAAK